MEDIINIGTFIKHLTYYVKMAIYINKGTDKDAILNRCIRMFNKYKTIEMSLDISDADEVYVRKCLKRLNLILKLDDEGNPVDIRKRELQSRMVFLPGHPSLANDDLNGMVKYATDNNIQIFTDIPLMFMLRESKFKKLLWQHTRALFYISQLLISNVDPDSTSVDELLVKKQEIFDDAAEKLQSVLEAIDEGEQIAEMGRILAVDNFLKTKLVQSGLTDKSINEARKEVIDKVKSKGHGNDSVMSRMIDSVSDKMIDMDQNKIMQNIWNIALEVANEVQPDLQKDPDGFQSSFGALTDILQDTLDNSRNNGEDIPDDLKELLNSVVGKIKEAENGTACEEDVMNQVGHLENIIESKGINSNEFFQRITDDQGKIKIEKLQDYMSKH